MSQGFKDIRDFIKFLEDKGDLVRVKKEVDPVLEINAIIDKLARTDGPAVLFEKVKGSDMPLLGNVYSAMRRIEWLFGTDSYEELARKSVKRLIKIMGGEKDDCLPVEVPRNEAVCKEVIIEEKDIDLNKFPLVQLWPEDGGKYLTLPLVITRSVESSVYNVGTYRMMMIDKNKFCMHWLPHKHGNLHFAEAVAKGQKEMNVAVAVGADPALSLSGVFVINPPLDEFIAAGVMKGSPTRLTKAENSDLLVPADAEIVFEGVVKAGELVDEGPFGEFHGFYSPVKQTPVFHVRKITMRKNPIWHAATTGMPPTEIHTMGKCAERLGLHFIKHLMPGIVDMNLTRESGTLYMMIIALNKTRPNEAKDLIRAMWNFKGQNSFITNIIIVDGDIDVKNLGQVIWAWSIHVRPELDVIVSDVGEVDLERPSTYPRGIGARMGIDATTKSAEEGYKREMPDVVKMDEKVEKMVDKLWTDYGFKKDNYIIKH